MNNEKPKAIKIKQLIEYENLKIPKYQRPYKWTIKNVNQLIDDILLFKDKKSYRFGTIVLHKDEDEDKKERLNIVDGQQRTITLILILLAIKRSDKFKEYKKVHEKIDIEIKSELKFNSSISQYNINQNYQEISRRINEFDNHSINFLLDKCEVIIITLNDLSEAFQFFDSQNARGRDLEPHDLLKAFHLREMIDIDEVEKAKIVRIWENTDQQELSKLFSKRLFRIRNWSRGNSARFFTKNDVALFKGISIKSDTKYIDPYAKLYQMANIFVDNYNSSNDRLIDFNPMSYPFQLDQPILNGKRFFEMISYYQNKYNDYLKDNKIIKMLDTYKGRHRTGDKYIREMFDCALIFYVDKFGEQEINKVIEKLFIWAYKLRLKMQAVYLATIDNHTLDTRLFKVIREASSYKDVVNLHVETLKEEDIKMKIEDIIEEFRELGYYNGK